MADEPTANLDSVTSQAILELMKGMNRELETTFIFSTHDPDIVSIADHVIRLQDGLIVKDYRTDDPVTPDPGGAPERVPLEVPS